MDQEQGMTSVGKGCKVSQREKAIPAGTSLASGRLGKSKPLGGPIRSFAEFSVPPVSVPSGRSGFPGLFRETRRFGETADKESGHASLPSPRFLFFVLLEFEN